MTVDNDVFFLVISIRKGIFFLWQEVWEYEKIMVTFRSAAPVSAHGSAGSLRF